MASSNLEKCINCLNKATSDNERFASLLMATKLVQADKCSVASRRALFEAVGFKFLKRLLKTETPAEGCTKWTYKSIAVTLLACFCSDTNMAVHADMLSCIPHFNAIITAIPQESGSEEEAQLISDSYECLTCLAAHPVGLDALIQHGAVTALCHSVARRNLGWQKAHQLLMYINNMCGVEAWRKNTDGLFVVLQHYAQLFNCEQGEEKFGYCRTLLIILSSVDSTVLEGTDHSPWSCQVYKGLCKVLQAKLSPEYREPALKLSSAVIDLLGVDWSIRGDDDSEKKFLLILVHLCCIEIRIALEQDSFEKVSLQGQLLTSCYKLLENIISYMSVGPTLALDEKQISQLHSAMTGAFNAVIHFLKTLEQAPSNQQQDAITMATVRVLGSWLAEETAALQKDVIAVIPFLLKLSKIAFDQQTQQNSRSSESQTTAQPESDGGAMETSSGDPDAFGTSSGVPNAIGTSAGDPDAMEDILRFLVPGLCHLSADDGARSVMLACGGHQLLAEYFSHQYRLFGAAVNQSERRESEVCLTTLCGVFLNLVVMETHLVSTDIVFSELLSFLITTLPPLVESGDHVILACNMCVLCLMLIRHHHDNLQVSMATCDAFLSCAITLLWCHEPTEAASSGEPCKLALREAYAERWEELSDLWFLGMQALCALVPLFGQLEQLVVKSGWIPHIVNTLLTVQGRHVTDVTRDSYSMLLYELASVEGGQSKALITEKGGREMARMYGMNSLLGALS